MIQQVTSVPDFGTPKAGERKPSQNDTNVYQYETKVYRNETSVPERPQACQSARRRASVPHACQRASCVLKAIVMGY